MTQIHCAFLATAQDAEIRKAKASGRDFLKLTVTRYDEEDDDPISVAVFSGKDELVETVKPGVTLYVEGTLKLRRWEDRDGVPQSALQIAAKRVEVLFELDAKPKARKTARGEVPTTPRSPAPRSQVASHQHEFNDEIGF